MRSIPATMTWEVFRRGRWHLLCATLGAIALPAMVFTALRLDGADFKDPSMLMMHILFVNNMILIIGAALFAAQGRISQLYAYPLSTGSIVAWRLLPAMVIIGALTAASIGCLNFIFNLSWPIWGPAMFAAVAMACASAFAWLTEKSQIWLAIAMAVVAAILGFWFKSRYGSAFSESTHYWQQVTPTDAFTMVAMSVFAYWVGVKGVARNRRGEPPFSLGWLEWLDRVLDRATAFDARLNSPFQAQCWFQWRRKGWVMPAGAFFCLVIGLIVWVLNDRQAESLVQGFFGGAIVLSMLGFIGGLAFGNVGPNDASYEIGQFLATRPTTDTDTARAIFLTAAKSVILAWAIWAVAFAVACAFIATAGSVTAIHFPKDDVGWWYFPVTFVGCWLVTSTIASVLLFGHSKYILQFLCGLAAAIIVVSVSSKFLLRPAAHMLLAQTLTALLASGLVIAGAVAFVAARHRRLIQSSTVWAAACIWIVATVLLAYFLPTYAQSRLLGYVLIAALVTLLVTPVAAAPLAISVNRHR
jgi:hypothetical protein